MIQERKKCTKIIFDFENQRHYNQNLIDDLKNQSLNTDVIILEHVHLNESFIDFVYKLFLKFNFYLKKKSKTPDLFVRLIFNFIIFVLIEFYLIIIEFILKKCKTKLFNV